MVKVRQDAWSHEDDLLLAETVLRHVREGSTQLNAFDEVGDKLNRTSAACGFRWNAEVRRKYDSAIDLAKRQRKEKKRAIAAQTNQNRQPYTALPAAPAAETVHSAHDQPKLTETAEATLTMDHVIHFLTNLKKDYHASNQSKITLEDTQQENAMLKERIDELKDQLTKTEEQMTAIREDYQTFVQIMDRARKMTVLDDQGDKKPPAFRMDKNGNLEQIAQSN
jgi:prespore-specific regulator